MVAGADAGRNSAARYHTILPASDAPVVRVYRGIAAAVRFSHNKSLSAALPGPLKSWPCGIALVITILFRAA
jgi:hypothetical protein